MRNKIYFIYFLFHFKYPYFKSNPRIGWAYNLDGNGQWKNKIYRPFLQRMRQLY